MATPEQRWYQILSYIHRMPDLKKFALWSGLIRVYHGAPTQFAKALVEHGPHVPYTVYALARRVASIYGLTWSQFQDYAYRKAEVVKKLSTATAPIACRWAWEAPLGEVLTDLNSHAMMVVAANALAKSKGISVSIAYDELHNKALDIARREGKRYTTESAPHILGLRDRMVLEDKTGSLVELYVDISFIDKHSHQHDAAYYLRAVEVGELTEAEALTFWNHEYRDFRVDPEGIEFSKIVIKDMESWEQDVIEGLVREGKLPLLPRDT